MPDQETRIKQGAAELRRVLRMTLVNVEDEALEYAVSHVFEAADREPPKWPSDATMYELSALFTGSRSEWTEGTREGVAKELSATDPIIQAAIEHRNIWINEGSFQSSKLHDAVNKAGL